MTTGRRATLVGEVSGVRGNLVTVRIHAKDHASILIDGESYRVGQVGAFVRIPIGYTSLYAVCVQVSASETRGTLGTVDQDEDATLGTASITAALFGESVGGSFERGVSRYPTVGDDVHVATRDDVDTIYRRTLGRDHLTLGRIASSQGLPAELQLSTLVTRHVAVVGSTGSGKSNLVAVTLEELASEEFESARVLVIDPHGEYSQVVPDRSTLIRSRPVGGQPANLEVPYWALPLDQLIALTMGELTPSALETIRDRVRELKVAAVGRLPDGPPKELVTADTPIPFSIWQLWYELEDDERRTFSDSNKQDATTLNTRLSDGNAYALIPPSYPPPTSTNTAPYPNRSRRNISRQLAMLRSRLTDPRFAFMFDQKHPTSPKADGSIVADLDAVLAKWIGTKNPITIVDVSGLPSEALVTVVGTMIQIIYDGLYWAADLPVGGRAQPLLIVVDEAHLFLPNNADSAAQRAFWRVAKEGRKYGVGLMVVTQRPSDIDVGVLSQCGTFVALRLTNGDDRAAVASAIPDDLSGLAHMLPTLRTGEALVLGEALQVPSRVRIRLAQAKPVGDDPALPESWIRPRPDPSGYKLAVKNWRLQNVSAIEGGNGE